MKRKTRLLLPIFLLLPAVGILFVFKVLPMLEALRLSFFDWGIAGEKGFVGFHNYASLVRDPFFWQSLLNTFWYVIFAVPLSIGVSFLVASLLNRGIKALGVFRTIYFLPVVTSIVAVSVVWRWLYDPQRGLFNYIIELLGFGPLQWLEEPRGIFELISTADLPPVLEGPSLALLSLVFLSVWKSMGYNIVIFLAGLKNIPEVYYEAARVDGAKRWSIVRHVTIPLLSPTIFFVMLMTTITSFQVFGPVWMMTGPPPGGPLGKTSVIVYYLFQKGFEEYQVGYGSAIAFFFFLIILSITLFQRYVMEKRVYYEVS
jgi:multiple sugar transport system permease protein